MKGVVLCALGILGCAASAFAQSLVSVSLFQSISNQSVRLSWPASASGFVLEETDALGGASLWQPVAQTPSLQDNQLSVTVSATGKSRYFRLRQTQTLPALLIESVGGQSVRLSWLGSATDFVLEETDALSAASIWRAVAQTPSLQSNRFAVTIAVAEKIHYYRLRQTQALPVLGFQITGHTPLDGANEVGVTITPQVFFSEPVNPASLGNETFFATAGGVFQDANIVPANDGSFAWLFFKRALPAGADVRVTLDGSGIVSKRGELLDADGDGTAGGMMQFSFRTVSTAALPGTSLSGIVVDPGPDFIPRTDDDLRAGPDGKLGTADDVFLLPIAGVKVYLLGRENEVVRTSANGRFHFDAVPVGDVKVVIDGTTATNSPAGMYFPEMVIDAQMVLGKDNFTMTNGTEVYLPRMPKSILQTVNAATTNLIKATPEGAQGLSAFQRNQLTIEVPSNSLVRADGQRVTTGMIGISTVPAELVRDMLPPGVLQHTFDITVQAPGIAKFSTPAPMTFPNVFNAPPGLQLNFLSFDHTTGRLVIEGTATVSADGATVRTDPGTGITHPGWHGLAPPGSPNDPPCNPTAAHDINVEPFPVIDGVHDYLFTNDVGVVRLSFGNAAQKQVANQDPCSPANIRATPLIISIRPEGPLREFLDQDKFPDLMLLPGQQGSVSIKMKPLLTPDRISKATNNILFGAKLKI